MVSDPIGSGSGIAGRSVRLLAGRPANAGESDLVFLDYRQPNRMKRIERALEAAGHPEYASAIGLYMRLRTPKTAVGAYLAIQRAPRHVVDDLPLAPDGPVPLEE